MTGSSARSASTAGALHTDPVHLLDNRWREHRHGPTDEQAHHQDHGEHGRGPRQPRYPLDEGDDAVQSQGAEHGDDQVLHRVVDGLSEVDQHDRSDQQRGDQHQARPTDVDDRCRVVGPLQLEVLVQRHRASSRAIAACSPAGSTARPHAARPVEHRRVQLNRPGPFVPGRRRGRVG